MKNNHSVNKYNYQIAYFLKIIYFQINLVYFNKTQFKYKVQKCFHKTILKNRKCHNKNNKIKIKLMMDK